jgi:hypothetical protein
MTRVLWNRRHLVVFGGGLEYVGQLGNWGRVGLAWYLTNQLDHTTEDELEAYRTRFRSASSPKH